MSIFLVVRTRNISRTGSNYAKWIVMLSSGGTLTSWNVFNVSHLSSCSSPFLFHTWKTHVSYMRGWVIVIKMTNFADWTVFVFHNCVIITHIVIRWLRCKEARVWGINNPRNSLTPVTTLMWVMHFTGRGVVLCVAESQAGVKSIYRGGWVGGWGHLSINMSLFPLYYRQGQPLMIVFKDIRLVLTNVKSARDKDIVRSFILPLCQQGTLVWALSRQPSSTLPS